MSKLGDHFVWSKIGDDAGELIQGILARKDAERRAGTFWWGIGSSLNREKLKSALNASGGTLPVLFSGQLSPPKQGGFEGMTLWTRWEDDTGSYEIPGHALVISKGRSTHYYALVCKSDSSIAYPLRDQPFDDQNYWNYPDGARPGSSQNTALLTGNMQADHTNGRYRRGFSATLVSPWLVTLAGPRQLTSEEQDQIAHWNGKDYSGLVRRIRG